MNANFVKRPRLKLEPKAYAQLRRQVLDRDGWRCQNCGRGSELQVHHLRFRSAFGDDEMENLITLCFSCHEKIHRSIGFRIA